MTQRTTFRLAWGLGLASFVFTVIAFIFLLPNYSFPRAQDLPDMFSDATGIAQSFIFACLGAFLALQRPRNPIGWLVLMVGLSNALSEASAEYSIYTMLASPGALAGGIWVTWFQQWIWIPYVVALGMILVLFPTGQLLSPRWLWLVYALVLASGVSLVATALGTPMYVNGELNHPVDNPLAGLATPLQSVFQIATNVSLSIYLLLFAVSLVSVAMRFRRACGAEREQIKWFAYAAVFVLLMVFVGNGLSLFGAWSQGIVNLALVALPIALVIAILRYHLYDIDIIIRRTLIYSIITAILALFYFGSIIVLQQLLQPIIGQNSDLAIIVSTLAIAALFNPLRHRVQEAIDHRFYRRKYDAQQVLERFAVTVRDEVELEKLTGELLNVVNETMQPTSVSLWVKKK